MENSILEILGEINDIVRNGFADGKIPYEHYTGITENLKKLNPQVIFLLPDSFSADALKEAYTDGFSDSRYDFDYENYR